MSEIVRIEPIIREGFMKGGGVFSREIEILLREGRIESFHRRR